MSWYLTWQDAAALALVLAGFAFALWLRRRMGSCGSGCKRCPLEEEIEF